MDKRICRHPRPEGFSMLEFIAVLAILGLFAVFAFSSVNLAPYDVSSETAKLKASLRYAQSLAFAQAYLPTGSDQCTWGLNITSTSYNLVRNGSTQTLVKLPGQSSASYSLPSGVSITPAQIYFNFRGMPASSTGAASGSDSTLTVSDSSESAMITVRQQTGFIP